MLELGIMLAEDDNIITQRSWLIRDKPFFVQDLRPRVIEMHTNNGLFDEVRLYGEPIQRVEEEALQFVKSNMPPETPWKLAGSSVHFDRSFLDKRMPKFANRLHYRILDVSSIKESLYDWAPELVEARPEPKGNHRALPDCIDSFHEWQYYKSVLLGGA
jgi:oligoribonuclease